MPSSGWDRVTYRGAGVMIPRPAVCYNKNGWLGPDAPSKATQEWGTEMVTAMADYIAAFVADFEKVPLPPVSGNCGE
jgi:creatinine amidohydrolase